MASGLGPSSGILAGWQLQPQGRLLPGPSSSVTMLEKGSLDPASGRRLWEAWAGKSLGEKCSSSRMYRSCTGTWLCQRTRVPATLAVCRGHDRCKCRPTQGAVTRLHHFGS